MNRCRWGERWGRVSLGVSMEIGLKQEMLDMFKTTTDRIVDSTAQAATACWRSRRSWPASSRVSARSFRLRPISREQLVFLTAEWKGERFPDGRPKVSDAVLARMRKVSIEEAWGYLRSHGYPFQFEGDWKTIHDNVPVVGRALRLNTCPRALSWPSACSTAGIRKVVSVP